MKQRGIFLLLLTPFLCCADEMVQPGFVPSAMQIPGLPTSLVGNNQQTYNANAMHQVASAIEQVLTKHDKGKKKELDPKKAKKKKEKSEQKQKATVVEDYQLAMMTEFLRAPEFAQPVSIKTRKIAVRDALLVLAKQAGVNILIDQDVQGSMPSLRADGLPANAVMQMVLDAHKPPLALLRVAGAWRVVAKTRADELAKSIAHSDILTDRRACKVQILYATWDEKLKATLQGLWQGIVGDVKDKLDTYLVFNDTSNHVFVCGRAQYVEKFKELVAVLDAAAPQVRLDMRVVCAGKNFESDLGLQWSGMYDRRAWAGKFGLAGFGIGDINPVMQGGGVPAGGLLPNLNPINTGQGAGTGVFKNLLGWALNAIPVNLATKAAAATTLNFPITFGGRNLEWGRLNLQLMAAEQNSEIKTILKPTLLVNNQETAEILVGQQLPHKVGVQEAVQGNVINAVSTFYKDVGTKIQVKPSAMVTAGQVVLDIFLEHSYITKLQQVALNTDDRGNYNYNVETARTRNKVVLKSGQTTMIGGLMVNTYEQVESGVPFLKDIPVLGLLFRGRSKIMIEKQLLIFITPTLVTTESSIDLQSAQNERHYNEQV